MKNGYDVAFRFPDNELFVLPVTPAQIKMSVGSNNEVVTLINGGDINIPKSPQLIEISFKARFPMRQYPYAKAVQPYQNYFEKFKKVKEDKKPFTFLVARETPSGLVTWDTELTVLLESFDINEDAENGDDVLIDFELKQYKNYGTKSVNKPTPPRTEKPVEEQKYIIRSGDTLWGIAKKFYGEGTYWTAIYNYNKSIIEAEAKKRGLPSSDNGHWIFAGCAIMIPNATVANQNKTTVVSESSTNKYFNLTSLASSSHADDSYTLKYANLTSLASSSHADEDDDDARYGGYDQVIENTQSNPNAGVVLNKSGSDKQAILFEGELEESAATLVFALEGCYEDCGSIYLSYRDDKQSLRHVDLIALRKNGQHLILTHRPNTPNDPVSIRFTLKRGYWVTLTDNVYCHHWTKSDDNQYTTSVTYDLEKIILSGQVSIKIARVYAGVTNE